MAMMMMMMILMTTTMMMTMMMIIYASLVYASLEQVTEFSGAGWMIG